MIALPFHPSNAYTIAEFKANMEEILAETERKAKEQFGLDKVPSLLDKVRDGKFHVDQAVIAGCSGGTYQNLLRASEILKGSSTGDESFWLSVYPGSMPVFQELTRQGALADLMAAGATIRSCFCGPCFGAGDVPANGGFSIRHSTRNFPNREGSKPGNGQLSYVALMDARSIAATAKNGGVLTSALELEEVPADLPTEAYSYDDSAYQSRSQYSSIAVFPSNDTKSGNKSKADPHDDRKTRSQRTQWEKLQQGSYAGDDHGGLDERARFFRRKMHGTCYDQDGSNIGDKHGKYMLKAERNCLLQGNPSIQLINRIFFHSHDPPLPKNDFPAFGIHLLDDGQALQIDSPGAQGIAASLETFFYADPHAFHRAAGLIHQIDQSLHGTAICQEIIDDQDMVPAVQILLRNNHMIDLIMGE